MKTDFNFFKNSGTAKIVFVISIIVTGYWWLGKFIDIYRFAAVGAIYELLWLPNLAMLFVLPVVATAAMVKEKFTTLLPFIISILLCVITILMMIYGR